MEPRPAKRAKKEASSNSQKQLQVRDKYEFGAPVGEGAFGCVYRAAERTVNSNTVAIKVFKKGKEGEGISFSHCREIAVRCIPSVSSLPVLFIIRYFVSV